MTLEKLCCYKPLRDNLDCVVPEDESYVRVDMFTFFRINVYSDVMLKINIEWSVDGIKKGAITSIRSGSHLWRSEKVESIMPFVRLRLVNESGQLNEEVCVHCFAKGDSRRKSVGFASPVELPKPDVIQSRGLEGLELDEPSHSIFVKSEPAPKKEPEDSAPPKKRHWTLLKKSSPKVPLKDDRLPELVPEHALLLGSKFNKLVILPRGEIGQYLMMTEDGVQWTFPYPPPSHSKEERAKMEASAWMASD